MLKTFLTTMKSHLMIATENSLCECVKSEYFGDLLDFTQSTLRKNGIFEDNVVLSDVRADAQDNSSDILSLTATIKTPWRPGEL